MSEPSDHDGDDDSGSKWVWPHPGDMGTILIAGVFLSAMIGVVLFLFSSPEPIRDMFGHHQQQQQPAKSDEVTINLQKK